MKKQVQINGEWITPPASDLEAWLQEVVAVHLDKRMLRPSGYVRRFQTITAVRRSPRHRAIQITVTP